MADGTVPYSRRGFILPVMLALFIGGLLGIGLFTFGYARGASYMTDNPDACANCHVMNEQYSGWMKGSHRKAAVCNDCHTPHGFLPKYGTKALNGFFHSLAFTTGRFPDDIQITRRNFVVAEGACQKCHEEITSGIQLTRGHREKVPCLNCHRDVGHAH